MAVRCGAKLLVFDEPTSSLSRSDVEHLFGIIDQLKAMGAHDNTLVLFLSDNGASAEIMIRGDGHDPHAECGTGATFLSIGPGWSSMC